jgi:chaperone BCS1
MINIQQLIEQAWEQASKNEFFQGGFLLGILAWIGMQLKSIPLQIWSRISRQIKFVIYIDNTNPMYEAFSEWYYENHPHSFKRVEARLLEEHTNGNKSFLLKIKQYTDLNWMWHRYRLLFVRKDKMTLEAARDINSRHIETYNISALFGRKVITDLIKDVEVWWNSKHSGQSGIRTVVTDSWAHHRSIYTTAYKEMENVYIDGKEDLMEDINNFMKMEDTYKKLGVRFKRGYLLYGPPGTGKTTLVYAVADWLKMPVYYLNPSGFSNDGSFEDFISDVEPWSIILIEEVDVFWTGRNDPKIRVTFQSLLNVLDGLHSPDNVLIFMTTNKPEGFDEAFVRKGRLDYKMYVGHPSKKMVEGFVGNFYDQVFVLDQYRGGIPMVDVQDVCIKNKDINKAKEILINLEA